MSYHEMSECTLTADERFWEKNKILLILNEALAKEEWKYTEKEYSFLQRMAHASQVSVRELFWLRDIKDKYL